MKIKLEKYSMTNTYSYIFIIYMHLEGRDGLGGRRRERGGRQSCSVTGAVGAEWGARERKRAHAGEMERVGGRKERKEKKKRGGEGRWGAGQLGPTSHFATCGTVPRHYFLTCGIVPRQKKVTWHFATSPMDNFFFFFYKKFNFPSIACTIYVSYAWATYTTWRGTPT